MRSSSTLPRLIAPLVLAAAAAALVVVVATSLDFDGGGNGGGADAPGAEIQQEPTTTGLGRRYVVKPGDTLSTIAEMSGVPIDVLVQLNPDLDPQALISGESVKLR